MTLDFILAEISLIIQMENSGKHEAYASALLVIWVQEQLVCDGAQGAKSILRLVLSVICWPIMACNKY